MFGRFKNCSVGLKKWSVGKWKDKCSVRKLLTSSIPKATPGIFRKIKCLDFVQVFVSHDEPCESLKFWKISGVSFLDSMVHCCFIIVNFLYILESAQRENVFNVSLNFLNNFLRNRRAQREISMPKTLPKGKENVGTCGGVEGRVEDGSTRYRRDRLK